MCCVLHVVPFFFNFWLKPLDGKKIDQHPTVTIYLIQKVIASVAMTQVLQPVLTLTNGRDRCCGRTLAGHQCTRSAAPGNDGFCRMHRRSIHSRYHPQQVQARTQQAIESRDSSREFTTYTPQSAFEVDQIRRALQVRRNAHEKIEKIKQTYIKHWNEFVRLGKDPVQGLLDINKDNGLYVLTTSFHNQYVAWKKIQPNYEPEECAICLEPCHTSPQYQSCGHAFHKTCIDRWKGSTFRDSRCPCCRAIIHLHSLH